MDKSKSFKPPIEEARHGQMIGKPGASLYGDNHKNFARAGAPKRLTIPNLVTGARRVTQPSHEFLHGAPLNDEPLQKQWEGKGNVRASWDMKDANGNGVDNDLAKGVLDEAGRLGAPRRGFER
jgi:hypothetical protein